MGIIKNLRMLLRAQQVKADKDIIEAIKKGIKIEARPECQHPTLKQVISKDQWYRCTKCKTVFFIWGASAWEKRQIPLLIKKLQEALKLKEQQ